MLMQGEAWNALPWSGSFSHASAIPWEECTLGSMCRSSLSPRVRHVGQRGCSRPRGTWVIHKCSLLFSGRFWGCLLPSELVAIAAWYSCIYHSIDTVLYGIINDFSRIALNTFNFHSQCTDFRLKFMPRGDSIPPSMTTLFLLFDE